MTRSENRPALAGAATGGGAQDAAPTATLPMSIVVPARDVERTIVACLRSALVELPDRSEVIVADHQSRDATRTLIERLGDSRVRVLPVHAASVGGVRNAAAEAARGRVLFFLDADCTVPPGQLSRLMSVFTDEGVTAAGSPYALPDDPSWIELAWHRLHEVSDLSNAKHVPAGNLAVRRDEFQSLGGFDANLISGEDAELCQRMRLSGFRLFVDSRLAVIHLGNPKTLRSFYRQQRWHAVGMMGTARRTPTELATLALLAFWLTVALVPVAAVMGPGGARGIAVTLGLLLSVPFASALFRAVRSRAFRYIPAGVVLYTLYFLARTSGAWRAVIGRGAGTAARRR